MSFDKDNVLIQAYHPYHKTISESKINPALYNIRMNI